MNKVEIRDNKSEKQRFLQPTPPKPTRLKYAIYLLTSLTLYLLCNIIISRIYYHYRINHEILPQLNQFLSQYPDLDPSLLYPDSLYLPITSVKY